LTDYAALLDVYTLEEILELNDMTTEELLIYLVEERVISLPEIQPIEFDD
jgi:hypothetical protein